ncbi:MAG: NADH dehydrogenase subunit [Bacteroidales bacterium]|nr:NADH dehydrogenase subunit [Bacteroidales bacterium]
MNYISIRNNQTLRIKEIPESAYLSFMDMNVGLVSGFTDRHCVNYFGVEEGNFVKLICCIADDATHEIMVSSCKVQKGQSLASFSKEMYCFERFEREIHENFGLNYPDHPWLKPVRYPADRSDKMQTMQNYPFYTIASEEVHEVGVGPIHAGIIEPGHFRFICNGEKILHLEIQLGYQHRGVENLFLAKKKLLQRTTLSENIAGDTVVGHSVAFAHVWESLCGVDVSRDIAFSRTVALELERMAIHIGDLSAICTDIAYQLGSSVFGRLRTPIVNFLQEWGGSRLAKGLIRPGSNPFPFTPALAERLKKVLDLLEPDYNEMCEKLFDLPSALSRFERTGVVSNEDAIAIGAVGMAARMTSLSRDIRSSHPYCLYPELAHVPILKHHGDVYSRVQIRRREVLQSMEYIRKLLTEVPIQSPQTEMKMTLQPDSFCLSLVEGWRGEICHCALTDANGELMHYKIKDPSFHNWMALALAVRNNEISDFPICNKSFNLSYSGHDL